jgi:Tfp pilus assembly PilM family ATPase
VRRHYGARRVRTTLPETGTQWPSQPLRRLTGSLTAVRETLESSVGLQKGLSPVAVDFGVSSLKLLQINATGETFNLVAGAMLETPEPLFHDHAPPPRLPARTPPAPSSGRAGSPAAAPVCSIPASQTFCKHLQLARLEGVSTAEAVKSTISGQLGCDPEALVYRHFEVKTVSQSGKVEVIGMAVGREMVQKLMAGLRKAKLELVGMHSEFAATLAAFDYLTRPRRRPPVRRALRRPGLVLHQDHDRPRQGPGLRPAASRWAGCTWTTPSPSQLKIPAGQAHAVRLGLERLVPDAKAPAPAQTVGDLPVQPDLSEPLEIIRDEIAISMRYHEALFPGKKIERAVFVGGESRQRPLCQQLARALRIPAQVADPLARVARTGKEPMTGVDLREAQPAWSVPLGLCLSKTDL